MIHFSRLTLATLLIGSLALPAYAQQVGTPSAPTAAKQAPAMRITESGTKKPGLQKDTHSTMPKAAPGSDSAGAMTKPDAMTTTAAPSKDVKAKDIAPKTN